MLMDVDSRASGRDGAGALLRLIRDGDAVTRADLARADRPRPLDRRAARRRAARAGLVYEAGGSASTGGRPPTMLAFNRDAGVVLVADLGATHARVAVSDLGGTPLAERASDLDIAAGPRPCSTWSPSASRSCSTRSDRAARRRARDRRRHARARSSSRAAEPVNPPIMPGWDGFPIPDWFAEPLRRAGARRQRRQHHGAAASTGRTGARPSTCC